MRRLLFWRSMKSLVVVLASLAVSSSVAFAETVDEPTEPSASVASDGYLAVGGLVGAHLDGRLGGALELGVPVNEWLLVHGMIAGGEGVFSADGGMFMQLRAGAEARICTASGRACAFAGADIGYDHEEVYASDGLDLLGPAMDEQLDGIVFVPRAGAEVGREIRLRGTLETPFFTATSDQVGPAGVQAIGSVVIAL